MSYLPPCENFDFPGEITVVGDDGNGRIIARWKGDPESDYRVERPRPMLCLVLITRLGHRVS